ncbi:glycosyltransferase family 2 protein [Flavobacterium sp. D33]|nr:glycosyltransferase family 2 protein [Flavobacterium selenitireducens]MBD3583429.1 glycosyltransferase family 2 protein [Flavobacterium selenitireducens]
MRFTLIICTYMRPEQLLVLLESVKVQTLYPDEILIVDGSTNDLTEKILGLNRFPSLRYLKVQDSDRGLTRQRNFGIANTAETSEIICFLDDDTVLEPNYFSQLLQTYADHPDALAVGGYITNEVSWTVVPSGYKPAISEFAYDGWKRSDGARFVTRKKLGLDSDRPPAMAPDFSNGRSVGFLPPSGKTYKAEQIMGGVSSFRVEVFRLQQFSTYFEGYGLYEDADFCFRLLKHGNLYVNTSARLEHHHAPGGRPNQFQYGRMVVRNGWYVWRVRTPRPSAKAKLKWHAIALLLAAIRFTNAIFGRRDKIKALTESAGRFFAYFELVVSKPKLRDQ